jgi:CheY-like chemotaxis protein
MLTRQGCVVETAQDGQQGLSMLVGSPDDPGSTGRRYDLVCLDNYMPVMSGEEAVRELRSLGRDDLVVGCTGTALTEDQASYMEAGADRVLAKPIMLKCVPFAAVILRCANRSPVSRDLKAMLLLAQERRTQPHAHRSRNTSESS